MREIAALAFMAFTLGACGDQQGEQSNGVGPVHAPIMNSDLDRIEGFGAFEALMPNLVMEKGFEPASYHVLRTKPLRFPSGRVIAADGIMLLPGAEPFTRTVTADAFPIELLIATYHLDSGDHEEIVLAAVRLSEAPDHALEWASYGEAASTWTGCYAVDSATGGSSMRTPTPGLAATFTDLGGTWNWPRHLPRAVVMRLSWKDRMATGQSSPQVAGTAAIALMPFSRMPASRLPSSRTSTTRSLRADLFSVCPEMIFRLRKPFGNKATNPDCTTGRKMPLFSNSFGNLDYNNS